MYDTFESELGLLTSFSVVPLRPQDVQRSHRQCGISTRAAFLLGCWGLMSIKRSCARRRRKLSLILSDGKSNFVVVDASVGWRFPKRYGIATLTVRNFSTRHFAFKTTIFANFGLRHRASPYIPERQVIGRVSLYF